MTSYKLLDSIPKYSPSKISSMHDLFSSCLHEVSSFEKDKCLFLSCRCNSDGPYYCRESNMDYINTYIESCTFKDVPYIHFLSSKSVGSEVCKYLNYIEGVYGFEGERSCILLETKYSEYDLFITTLRLSSEWFLSPTMYQLLNLVVRYIVMSMWGAFDGLVDLSKLDTSNKDILHVFHPEGYLKATSANYVGNLYPQLEGSYDFILSNRKALFSGSMEEEWSADTVETSYGTSEEWDMFSYSGTSSFYSAMLSVITGRRIVGYFKYITKKDIITNLFKAYLNDNPNKKKELFIE